MKKTQWRVIRALFGGLLVLGTWALLGVPLAFSSPAMQEPPTPVLGPYCIDNSAYVADVTVPDGTLLAPSQTFNKIWRIRNNGTCTWGPGYTFAFISGEPMTYTVASQVPAVAASPTITYSITATVPVVSPTIVVTPTATSTPSVTATVTATASLTATVPVTTPTLMASSGVTYAAAVTLAFAVPTTAPGQTVDLLVPLIAPPPPGIHVGYWRLRSPTGEFFGETPYVKINVLGAQTYSPPRYDRNYYGYPPYGYYPYGYYPYVYPPYVAPVQTACYGYPSIQYFTASATTISAGSSTTLQWGLVGNANWAGIDNGIGGVATPGSISVSPSSTTTYTLTGYCGSNTVSAQVTINVVAGPPGGVFRATLQPPRHLTVVPAPGVGVTPDSRSAAPGEAPAKPAATPTATPPPGSPAPRPRLVPPGGGN